MESIQEFWHAASRDPIGWLLTLLGVVLGSASLVFLASGLEGASYALVRTAQSATGDDIVRILPERPQGPRADFSPPLSRRDANSLAEKERLSPSQVGTGIVLHRREASVGTKTMPVGLQSANDAWLEISGFKILHGRMLSPSDAGKRHCLLGHDVWTQLFDGKWPLPSPTITIEGSTQMIVIGVLHRRPPMGGGGGGETWRVDRKVFIPEATFERVIRPGSEDTVITLKYGEGVEDAKTTSLRLRPYMLALHRGVESFSFEALRDGMGLDEIIRAALMAVLLLGGLLAIGVGGINVMNSQLVTIEERAREFAIRRALGLSAVRLRRGVLVEAVGIAVGGAVVGVGVGLLLAWGLSAALTQWVAPWPFSVVPWSVGGALVACGLAGLAAGWIPAQRAAMVPPAVVLRSE